MILPMRGTVAVERGGELAERKKLLAVWSADDFRRRETEAEIALDEGRAEEALRLLTETCWERHHARHRRGEIWKAAHKQLGLAEAPVPTILGEDPLTVEK